MRNILVATSVASLLACSAASAVTVAEPREKLPYPTNHGSELASELPKLDGKLVAIEIRVEEIRPGPHNKPYLRASFSDSAKAIWLAPIVDISNHVEVGDVLRVYGFVSAILEADRPALNPINSSGYHILAMCYYNFRTEVGLFFPFSSEPNQCSRWRDGEAIGL